MTFNCEMLQKIEVGTIFYKNLGEDKLEYKETVLLYDNVILTGKVYKGLNVSNLDNFKVIAGVYGNRLFDPDSFDSDPDKETFYILLENNLHPSHSNKMQELIQKEFVTQDKSEFVDILNDLIFENLRHRITINKNSDYVMYIDSKHFRKEFKLIQKDNSKDLEITNSIEDYTQRNKYWRSLYIDDAKNLIIDFSINFVELLSLYANAKPDIESGKYQSSIVKHYHEYVNSHKDDDQVSKVENKSASNGRNSLEIIEKVKSKIVSQDKVIKSLVPVLLSNYKLVNYGDSDLIQTEKHNILLIGPTGVGKTAIVRETAKHLGIPIVKTAATNFSGVGYVDSSLTEILYSLIVNANNDIKMAEKGIIFFDEVDKLFNSNLKIRDGIVDELLSWISGTNVQIKSAGMTIDFDTSLLTFIFGGAFSDIYSYLNKKLIGVGNRCLDSNTKIDQSTLINFGVKDEFAGRLSLILELNPLKNFESLRNILIFSEISPLKNMKKFFEIFYNLVIDYNDDIINEITNRALLMNIGARGLNSEVAKLKVKLLEAVEFGLFSNVDKITLTLEMLDDSYVFSCDSVKKLVL